VAGSLIAGPGEAAASAEARSAAATMVPMANTFWTAPEWARSAEHITGKSRKHRRRTAPSAAPESGPARARTRPIAGLAAPGKPRDAPGTIPRCHCPRREGHGRGFFPARTTKQVQAMRGKVPAEAPAGPASASRPALPGPCPPTRPRPWANIAVHGGTP
jgi:hypothetical protein